MEIPNYTVQLPSALIILLAASGCIGFQYPETGLPCIILNMDATLQVTQTGDTPVQVTTSLSDAVVDRGTCAGVGENAATLNLNTNGTLPASLSFFFSKTVNSTVLMDILVKFEPEEIFKNNDTDLQIITDDGKTNLSKDTSSYNCTEERELRFRPVNSTIYNYTLEMTISNVVIQAFNIINGNLSEVEYCNAGQTTLEPTSEEQTTQPIEPTESTSSLTTKETMTTEPITTDATSSGTVITTSPSITPAPGEPPVQSYAVKGENGTCILMEGGIQFTITYNATNELKTKIIGVPPISQVTYDGDCDNANDTSQSVEIKFYDDWNVRIKFSKYQDQSAEKYFLSEIDLTANLSKELFPDIESPVIQNVVRTYSEKTVSASVQGSYRCTEQVEFVLNQDFSMDTFNLQFAAFQQNITSFKDSDLSECKSDVTSNSDIPIAVGASLGGLILIVLVAYLIGRRCETRNSYDTI